MFKTYVIGLGYFKRGDDMCHHLAKTNSPQEALVRHAEALEADALTGGAA